MTMGDRVAVMRDGKLQQVDRPQALYDRPVNLFVAGFVGSPAMNLVRSALTQNGDTLSVHLGDRELRLPATLVAKRPRLEAYTGKPVIVGVRPEDIEDATFVSSANGSSLDVRVSIAEPMGAEVIAYFPVAAEPLVDSASVAAARETRDDATGLLQKVQGAGTGEMILTARLNTRTRAGAGKPLRVAIDVERLHFFDPTTEEAIW
jgi:multiple sugar transport system ATP-binding protein